MAISRLKVCEARPKSSKTLAATSKTLRCGHSTARLPNKLLADRSDCLLKPVKVIPDPGRLGTSFFVMCEVLNADGTPHRTNGRATIDDDDNDFWFGFEQEYTLVGSRDKSSTRLPRRRLSPDRKARTTVASVTARPLDVKSSKSTWKCVFKPV